ncbi:hypothetical protein [Pseudomonas putida]|uniref:Uncharacterized protein n=1 Tax=Pseudomonas putida TaxID=303 RepID=A0A8I1JIM5_PSEPU|nr:hypothetical protein [Pseudomonas putida]MBI6882684.1 hypothetical protein [Pseudomonas putida]
MRFEDQPWYQEVLGYNYHGLIIIWVAMAVAGICTSVFCAHTLLTRRKELPLAMIFHHAVMIICGLFAASFIFRSEAQILLELQTRVVLAIFGFALSARYLHKIYKEDRKGLANFFWLVLAVLAIGTQLNGLSVLIPDYSVAWIVIALCESVFAIRLIFGPVNENNAMRYSKITLLVILSVNWIYLNLWPSLSLSLSYLPSEKYYSSIIGMITVVGGCIYLIVRMIIFDLKKTEPTKMQENCALLITGIFIISIAYGLDLVIDPMMYSCRWLCLLPNNFVWP